MIESSTGNRCSSFQDFWPYYVSEHLHPTTRRLHFIGTSLLAPIVLLAILDSPLWLVTAPVVGYGFAWAGHFFVEKNRPATFTYPVWSLRGDFVMFWLMLCGRMDSEVISIRGQQQSDRAHGRGRHE